MNLLNSPAMNLLERAMDAAALRQKTIANNVANVDTPFFKRSDVKFEELLQRELEGTTITGYRTDPRHFYIGGKPLIQPEIVTDEHTAMNNNLNNVDIDYEMSLMAKNQLRYNVMVQQINHDLRQIRTAIEGRR